MSKSQIRNILKVRKFQVYFYVSTLNFISFISYHNISCLIILLHENNFLICSAQL